MSFIIRDWTIVLKGLQRERVKHQCYWLFRIMEVSQLIPRYLELPTILILSQLRSSKAEVIPAKSDLKF